MAKREIATTTGGDLPSCDEVCELHLCGDGEGCLLRRGGEAPSVSRSAAEREERTARIQERVAWVTLAGVFLPALLGLAGPSQSSAENVQVNVSVVVVEDRHVMNPESVVQVQMKEEMKK
ncbi:hypothetical protein ACGFNQ_35870 [Streptomyces asoensis]|uniref:hypothetical protein n=1 Tax=Streptomyces asoensis TaxID=249586 RepID=UPI003720433D